MYEWHLRLVNTGTAEISLKKLPIPRKPDVKFGQNVFSINT